MACPRWLLPSRRAPLPNRWEHEKGAVRRTLFGTKRWDDVEATGVARDPLRPPLPALRRAGTSSLQNLQLVSESSRCLVYSSRTLGFRTLIITVISSPNLLRLKLIQFSYFGFSVNNDYLLYYNSIYTL